MASSDVEIKTEPLDEDYSAIKEEELIIPFTWIGGDHMYCKYEPGTVSDTIIRNSMNLLIPKEEPLEVDQPEVSELPKDGCPSEKIPKIEPLEYSDDDDEPLLGFDDNLKPVTERYYDRLSNSVDNNAESPIDTQENTINSSSSDPEFHCSICKRYFISKKELHFHKCLRHRNDNVCTKCGEVFRSQTILKVHLEVHDRRERYLNLHKKEKKSPPLRRHAPKLPVKSAESDQMLFGCNECDMMFSTPQKLNNHARAHNGYKYYCNRCGKSFRYLAVMKNHLRGKACMNEPLENIIRESRRISDDDYLVENMRVIRNSSITMAPSDVGANVIIDNDGNQFVIKEENFSPESLPKEIDVIKTEPIIPKEEDQSDTDSSSDDFTDRLLQELIDRKSRSIAKERTITFETASSFMKKLPEKQAKCEPDLKRIPTSEEKTKSISLPKLNTPKQPLKSILTYNPPSTEELIDPRKKCEKVFEASPAKIDKRKYLYKRNMMPEHYNPNLPITGVLQSITSFIKKFPEQSSKFQNVFALLSATAEKRKYVCESNNNSAAPLGGVFQTVSSSIKDFPEKRAKFQKVLDVLPQGEEKIKSQLNSPPLPIACVRESVTASTKELLGQCSKPQNSLKFLPTKAEEGKTIFPSTQEKEEPTGCGLQNVASSIKEFPEKREKFQKVLEVLPPVEEKVKSRSELYEFPKLNNPTQPIACVLQSVQTPSTKELLAQFSKIQNNLIVLPKTVEEEETISSSSQEKDEPTGCVLQNVASSIKEFPEKRAQFLKVLEVLPRGEEKIKSKSELDELPTLNNPTKPIACVLQSVQTPSTKELLAQFSRIQNMPKTVEEEKTISSSSQDEPTGCVLEKVTSSTRELRDEKTTNCQSVLEVLPKPVEKEKTISESSLQPNVPAQLIRNVLQPVTPLAKKHPDELVIKLPTVKRKDTSEERLHKLLFKKFNPKPKSIKSKTLKTGVKDTQKNPIPQTFIPADIMQKYRDDEKQICSTQHTARTKQTLETLAEQCRLNEAKLAVKSEMTKAFQYDKPTLSRYKDKFIETYHRWHPLTRDLQQAAAVHPKNMVKAPDGDLKENYFKKMKEEVKDPPQKMAFTSFPKLPPTQKPATDRPQDALDFEEIIMLNTVACTTINGVPAAIEVRHEPAVHPKLVTCLEAEEAREDSAPHEDEQKVKAVETAMEQIQVTETCKERCENSNGVEPHPLSMDESSQNTASALETPPRMCIKTEEVSPVSTSDTIDRKIKKPKGTYKIESPFELPKEKIEFMESLKEGYEKAKQLKIEAAIGDESSQNSTSTLEAPPRIYYSVLDCADPIPGPFQIKDQSYHYLWCCTLCTRRYVKRGAFVNHLMQIHNKQKSDLAKELYELRPEPVTLTNASDNSFCELCNVNLGDPELLQKHIKELHKDKTKPNPKFKCSTCGKYCATYSGLTTHINSNCGREPQYACTVCGKSFFTKSTLNLHRTIHTGELPHKCGYCDKRFRTRGQVTVHTRTHTGERPFVCKVCDRRFTHRETLISHLSRHIDMKRFRCDGCQRHFACISGLTTHRLSYKDTCGKFKLNSRSVGVRVRVVKGNVLFEPQTKINPYARPENIGSESTSQNVDQVDMREELDVVKTNDQVDMREDLDVLKTLESMFLENKS